MGMPITVDVRDDCTDAILDELFEWFREVDDRFSTYKPTSEISRINRDELVAGLSYHGPLNYPPLVAKERRIIITGLGDRMAPPGQAVLLWEHWDRCAMHWFPGNHVLHVSQLDYLRRMTPFLHHFMFD